MPLDLSKLECVRVLGDRTHARCPACAECGGDKKGQHLMIDAEGRFGCAVHASDPEHRRRIWTLAGGRARIPPFAIAVRPVVIRRGWQVSGVADRVSSLRSRERPARRRSPDASDGTFNPFRVLVKYPYAESVVFHPSERSETPPTRNPTSSPPAKPEPPLAAVSAPVLVPRDAPFVDGQRYRLAEGTEFRTRLDLYVADPDGPWIRRHSVLMAAPTTTSAPIKNKTEPVSTTLIIGDSVERGEWRDGRWTPTRRLPDLCSCRGHCFCRQRHGDKPATQL